MRFVDLFAGLGGFHLALAKLGHTCVFASEIDETLCALYERNFGLSPSGDIRDICVTDIPSHDVLCAGFPCQPFSKAGSQRGLEHPLWGDLFDHLLRIINHHKPQFLMLENVPNLRWHDDGRTWDSIEYKLRQAGYDVKPLRLSPHRFGIPQVRERMFIVASRSNLSPFILPQEDHTTSLSIHSALDHYPPDAQPLSARALQCLDVWQEFLNHFPEHTSFPSHPIWAMEFGATYPYEETTPFIVGARNLRRYCGSLGVALDKIKPAERIAALPSYARTEEAQFPKWKINFIRRSRELYKAHREWIDPWLIKVSAFPPSWQKLEWNCKGGERDIWRYIIQFRASGVRVKRPATSPSLIAMTTVQVPIVAWEKRYMTPKECARLQSMEALPNLPTPASKADKALGNAVNVDLVTMIAQALLESNASSMLLTLPLFAQGFPV